MQSDQKHAYLIMAHHNFNQLKCLISLLDHPRNDIYLHVDKRAADFRPAEFRTIHSRLILVDRIRVNWAGHSQIRCELNLLKAAVPRKYQYYHLLSGVDLPLRTQNEIHAFFDADPTRNFLRLDKGAVETGWFLPRIRYYYLFQDLIGRNKGIGYSVLGKIQQLLVAVQKKLGLCRKMYITPYKGTNWFSITHGLAQHILSQEKLIRRQFFHSYCADEVFAQSVAMASEYRQSLVSESLRAIDWHRGNPYTYREEDVDALFDLPKLFARKFDESVDPAAIDRVAARVRERMEQEK